MDKDKRAQRLLNNERIAKKRSKHQNAIEGSEKNRGMRLHTATLCSCAMCGNPRKFTGKLTIQELRHCQNLDCDYYEDADFEDRDSGR